MEPTSFWQANFWGIIGTISGVFGLVFSWLNWRYSRPKIILTDIILQTKEHYDKFVRSKESADLAGVRNQGVSFYIYVKIANRRGGPGAIEKPNLIFRVRKSLFLAQEMEIEPVTKSYAYTQTSSNSYSTEEVDLGRAFNLKSGEIIDATLEYPFRGQDLLKLAQNYSRGKFYIRYFNNFGRKFEKQLSLQLTKH